MTQYSDEYILKAKAAMKIIEETKELEEEIENENNQSIYDKTTSVYGVLVEFEGIKTLNDKAMIRIPKTFIKRNEEEIESVYFLGSKPQYVYSDGILPFMIALNHTETVMLDDNMKEFGKLAKNIIDRIGPKSKFLEEQFLKLDTGNLFILQTVMQTIDGVINNIMFFASVEEKLVIGSITFDTIYAKRLMTIAMEIAKSFQSKITEEEEDEHNRIS